MHFVAMSAKKYNPPPDNEPLCSGDEARLGFFIFVRSLLYPSQNTALAILRFGCANVSAGADWQLAATSEARPAERRRGSWRRARRSSS